MSGHDTQIISSLQFQAYHHLLIPAAVHRYHRFLLFWKDYKQYDKPETVKKRLSVYHDQTQPLIDYYKNEGILAEVDGTKDMEEVFQDIVKILGA